MKTACVISGGGSWGAWGCGVVSALNKDFDMVFGVSTGSLLASHTALKDYEKLKLAYTTTSQSDIFNVNPVNSNGKVKIFNAIKRVILGKNSIGETIALRNHIDKFFDKSDFTNLKVKNKLVSIAVQNLSRKPFTIEHKSNKQNKFDDFKDWIWASSSVPILGTLIYKNGMEYADAGVSEILSLVQAINCGAKDITVVVHRTYEDEKLIKDRVSNVFHLVLRILGIMRQEVETTDISEGIALAEAKGCKLTFYYMRNKPQYNSMVFDKNMMTEEYENAYTSVKNHTIIKKEFDFTKNC